MTKRVTFSGAHMSLERISAHYLDCETAIAAYFDAPHDHIQRFRGLSRQEVLQEKAERIEELSLATSLTVVAAVEAVFRIDYLQRVYTRRKDPLSKAFRELHESKGHRVALEELLEIWKQHTQPLRNAATIMSDLKGVLLYRHWLAHGRYWVLKAGRSKYDFETVYGLAEQVISRFPFEGMDGQ